MTHHPKKEYVCHLTSHTLLALLFKWLCRISFNTFEKKRYQKHSITYHLNSVNKCFKREKHSIEYFKIGNESLQWIRITEAKLIHEERTPNLLESHICIRYLADSLPPFTIYILNRLDMMVHLKDILGSLTYSIFS